MHINVKTFTLIVYWIKSIKSIHSFHSWCENGKVLKDVQVTSFVSILVKYWKEIYFKNIFINETNKASGINHLVISRSGYFLQYKHPAIYSCFMIPDTYIFIYEMCETFAFPPTLSCKQITHCIKTAFQNMPTIMCLDF